ncbi:hypothetical protein CKALI_06585 [Corynebacterium kalinowskii]|uniref:DUF3159 domain-containing protein n=1 Tax=Corynebacterium kalinowskii TaxID=2675216 RepID=A0A6B8VGP5_9CORY|nr:DUF3159 domain-containing protein [Corynebacterium kalinowskii]QGU02179.1 hypothetical protein CKALI_06585 [Corynebacterium kalinowskii]
MNQSPAVQNTEAATDAEPTLLEQMGGLSGLVSSTLPILVLIPVNNRLGLLPALAAALGVALVIAIVRMVRKENMQPAVSGVIGVAIGAGIAWYTGDAKGYFLYGIWVSLLFGIVFLLSIASRWPAVGVIWRGINGEDMSWRKNKIALRMYDLATGAWAVVFFSRFFVQNNLYNQDATNTLAAVKLIMGWPLTGLVTLLTVWAVRRANAAQEEAQSHG